MSGNSTKAVTNAVVDKAKLEENAKRIFEGECCSLSYNDDQQWFDDEDEEFVFTDTNRWFVEAADAKGDDEYFRAYLEAKKQHALSKV
jgi:hypothetical protein